MVLAELWPHLILVAAALPPQSSPEGTGLVPQSFPSNFSSLNGGAGVLARARAQPHSQGMSRSTARHYDEYRAEVITENKRIPFLEKIHLDIFRDEEECIPADACPDGHLYDPWNWSERTTHVLVRHIDGSIVGAGRVIRGQRGLAHPHPSFGVPMEEHYDLRELVQIASCVAEVGRVCIYRRYRGSGASLVLYQALAREALAQGTTLWIGSANTGASHYRDALARARAMRKQGRYSSVRFHRKSREGYRRTGLSSLKPSFSPTSSCPITSYVDNAQVIFASGPHYDHQFRRFAIPFMGDPRIVMRLCESRGVGPMGSSR